MGDPFLVQAFAAAFVAPVDKWSQRLTLEGITGPLHGGFEDFTIDVSLSKYADDLYRVIPLEVGCDMDEALRRMKGSDDILD
eukprot:6499046-Pyramimonas_sp.AAC.1